MTGEPITTTLTWGPFDRIRADGSLSHLVDWRVRAIRERAESQGYAVCVLHDERTVRVVATRTDAPRVVTIRRAVRREGAA
jgi:hypothetical protein